MALMELQRIEIGPQTLTYRVAFPEKNAPLMTSDNIEAVHRIITLLPGMVDHVCVSEAGDTLKAALAHTEIAHVLEHGLIELLALTGRGDIITGRTRKLSGEEVPTWETMVTCDDDTLTIAALRSVMWVFEWAYRGSKDNVPNIEAIVESLNALIDKIDRVPKARNHAQDPNRFSTSMYEG